MMTASMAISHLLQYKAIMMSPETMKRISNDEIFCESDAGNEIKLIMLVMMKAVQSAKDMNDMSNQMVKALGMTAERTGGGMVDSLREGVTHRLLGRR